jgi:hypothetical protein
MIARPYIRICMSYVVVYQFKILLECRRMFLLFPVPWTERTVSQGISSAGSQVISFLIRDCTETELPSDFGVRIPQKMVPVRNCDISSWLREATRMAATRTPLMRRSGDEIAGHTLTDRHEIPIVNVYTLLVPSCRLVEDARWSVARPDSQKVLYPSWLTHYAVSIPDEVIWFFNWPNPSSRTMTLGSTQPLTEMSTRNLPGE